MIEDIKTLKEALYVLSDKIKRMKYDIKLETQYVLEDALDNMNEYIKNHIPNKLSDLIISPNSGGFLFALYSSESTNIIELNVETPHQISKQYYDILGEG